MRNIEEKFELAHKRFEDPNFLSNKGLGNEVGIHVFQYDPEDELKVRAFIKQVKSWEHHKPYRIIHFDLYEVFLEICNKFDVLEDNKDNEELIGSIELLKDFGTVIGPKEYIKIIDKEKFVPNQDIVILSGIGRVYPMMRAHLILNNIHHIFTEVPVVLFYPGQYDGQSLTLFGKFFEDNYYRAFSLI